LGGAVPTDEEILAPFQELELTRVLAEAGGLDKEQEWGVLLPLPDQHLCLTAILAPNAAHEKGPHR
jgi:hypothetical protein